MEAPPFEVLYGLRTLVLDDNETNRLMLQRSLSAKGLAVEIASLGREALRKVFEAADAGRPFDLVLIDLHLPDMDGFQVAERLRERFPTTRLALMMITSDDVAGGARRARELGISAYLVKPVRVAALMEALVQVRRDGEEVGLARSPGACLRSCHPALHACAGSGGQPGKPDGDGGYPAESRGTGYCRHQRDGSGRIVSLMEDTT